MMQEEAKRKSRRAHVPNLTYQEGIDELRKEAQIRYRKKCKNSPHSSLTPIKEPTKENLQLEPYKLQDDKKQHLADIQLVKCILPNGQFLHLEVLISKLPSRTKIAPLQTEKPIRKHSADLLSIFQQAIKQIGQDINGGQINKDGERRIEKEKIRGEEDGYKKSEQCIGKRETKNIEQGSQRSGSKFIDQQNGGEEYQNQEKNLLGHETEKNIREDAKNDGQKNFEQVIERGQISSSLA